MGVWRSFFFFFASRTTVAVLAGAARATAAPENAGGAKAFAIVMLAQSSSVTRMVSIDRCAARYVQGCARQLLQCFSLCLKGLVRSLLRASRHGRMSYVCQASVYNDASSVGALYAASPLMHCSLESSLLS